MLCSIHCKYIHWKWVHRVSNGTGQLATFRDKGTEVTLMSQDKGTTGQAQNLTKGQVGPGKHVKIQNRMRDGTVRDFDSLSRLVPGNKTGQNTNGHSITGKVHSKTEMEVLKQERMF